MKKYIGQIRNENYVYPNNTRYEYDSVIVHSINNNSPSGTVTNVQAIPNGSTIDFSFDFTWNLNGAEPYVRKDGMLSVFSLHIMEPGNYYLNPWKVVGDHSTPITGSTSLSGTFVANLPYSISGEYYYEVRFIGHRTVSVVCDSIIVTFPEPTPTPTPTIPVPTTTPTPTPTSIPPTFDCSTLVTGTYSGNGYYMYPDRNVYVTGTTISFNYSAIDRPNRFTIYDHTGNFLGSSGWAGTASYAGPWGINLTAPSSGTITVPNSYPYLVLRVETGNGSISDAYEVYITCNT